MGNLREPLYYDSFVSLLPTAGSLTVAVLFRLCFPVGQLCKLRADFIGAARTGMVSTNRPVANRPQDSILPHI
jgi:hypothetical protein